MAEAISPTVAKILGPKVTTGTTPGVIRAEEDEVRSVIRNITEQYQTARAQNFTRTDFLPPIQERKNPLVDLTQILVGTEMAAVGVSLDDEGFRWQLETAKDAWAEHPIRNVFTLGIDMLPVVGAIHKGFRASKLAGIPDFELKPFVDEGMELAQLSKREQEIVRINAWSHIRRRELEEKVNGKLASPVEQLQHYINKRWSNQYTDLMDPSKPLEARSEQYNRMQAIIKNAEVNKHLADLPPESLGPAITRYYADETMLSKIPLEHQPWAMRMKSKGRHLMDNMESEGFITADERAKVGDVWYSLVRRGTPARHEGLDVQLIRTAKGGKEVKVLGVPRTESVHLLRRTTDKTEAAKLVDRTEALDLLKDNKVGEAAKLLTRSEDAPIKGLIAKGDVEGAKAALIQTKDIVDITTSDLTVKNLLQQHLLFENFRYIRDIAMNKNYTKNIDEFLAMTPSSRRDWVSLDQLPNSHIIRRMMGKRIGREHDGPLGYIRGELFRELTNTETGMPAVINGMATFIDWHAAVHKTARTALNVPTQLQNIGGNIMNMVWAGMNPFSPDNFKLLKTSFHAAWRRSKSRKGEELGVLGKIKSHVGGPDIDINEEFLSGKLAALMDESSFAQAEGLDSIQRLLDKTTDTQMFMKKLLEWTQVAAKANIGPLSVETASDAYTTVDSAFKLAYYLNLRQRGLSSAGASMEVARRFPIYHTVAPNVRQLRRFIFPWLSFPVETMRIVKNNVVDYPLRMAVSLHATEFLQSLMYPFMDQSGEGIKDTVANLPTWAQKPTTVVTPFRDKNEDIRAAVLDWLPHAAFLPQSYAPEAPLFQKLPAGIGEPIPILQGLVQAFTGKDTFGNDIPYDPSNPAQLAASLSVNLMGTLAPPMVGKYLLNPTAPDYTYRLRQEFGQAVSPATGKPGDYMFDFFANNIGAPAKFFPASGEQYLANQSLVQRGIEAYRGSLSKKWGAYVKSGDWQNAAEVATTVQETFIQQWKDPIISQQKFREWLDRHSKGIEKHPQLRGFSKEQISQMIQQASDESAIIRSNAARARLSALRAEAANRGFDSGSGSTNPLLGGMGIGSAMSTGGGSAMGTESALSTGQ